MTIAQNFASKLAVAFVAIAMIFMAIAPAVQAAETAEDLQTTINDLLAQVAALQSELGDDEEAAAPAMGSCNFTMDLKTGSTGADVKALQEFLNADADTMVAASGVGSAGMETMTFGPMTAAAVSKFQVKYRAEILSPAGLVNPTGFFGPGSRAQANALCAGGDDSEDTDEDTDSEDEDTELSGEASLKDLELDDADQTDVQEGDEDVEIGVITVEFEDGDASISRIDVDLNNASSSDGWDVFEEISLWVDGEKVAEVDASDEDEYLDEDTNEIRFAGLDIVAMEDEELDITIGATLQGSIDTEDLATSWDIDVNSMRFFDADGVATTETTGFTGDADFTIEVAGEGEELNFSLSSSNPDAMDIVVDTDSKTNDVEVLAYDIEAKEGDIELNTLALTVVTTGEAYNDIVSDMTLEVDGQSFDVDDVVNGTTTTATVYFDIDGDVTIDEDEEVAVSATVDFKSQTGNYDNGDTIKVSANVNASDAEGADDVSDFSGSAVGKVHTLVAEGIVLPVDGVETTTSTTGDNDQTGKFTIEFEVSAVEGDFYITDNVAASTSATDGIAYEVEVSAGTTTNSGILASTADEETDGVFVVRDGETETFTLTVTIDTSATAQARVTLTEVNYSTNVNGVTGALPYGPTPASDFRTAYETINAN